MGEAETIVEFLLCTAKEGLSGEESTRCVASMEKCV